MASTIKVDKLDPQSGTALEIGTSGDTVTVPSGVGLTLTDSTLLLPTTITSTTEVKTNKISPATGVAFTLGDSGDTFTVPSGATIVNSGTATGFGGGAWSFVSRAAIGGSDVPSVVFTSLSSGYTYLFIWNGIDSVADSTENFYMQVSNDNGSAYRTSGYLSALFQHYSNGGEDSTYSTAGFMLSENQATSDVAEGNNGFLYLHNNAAALKTAVTGQNVTMGDSSNSVRANTYGAMYDTAEATDAVRFLFESGDITATTVGYISQYKQIIT